MLGPSPCTAVGFYSLQADFSAFFCLEVLWWSQGFGTNPISLTPTWGSPSSSVPLGFKSQFN